MDNCKKINLNDYAYVKLTTFGKKVLFDYCCKAGVNESEARKLYNMRYNTIKIQLWELAHIFGPNLYNGATEHPFTTGFIFIPEEKLK